MTTAHAEPSAGDHAHDDDHAHAFDGEPIKTLPADEPRTPGWLPALGLVLFVAAGVAYLVTSGDTPSGDAAPAKAAQQQAAAPSLGQAPAPQPAQPAPDAQAGAAAAAKLSPEQLKQIQQLLQQEQAKRGVAPNGVVGPAPH